VHSSSALVIHYNYADKAAADDIVFVYTGGRVPEHLREIITHARIDESVTTIDDGAFDRCFNLLDVNVHDGVERVRKWSFRDCHPFLRATLPGVEIIGVAAFENCFEVTDVEFGNELETIGWVGILELHLFEAPQNSFY
jgi:hypothetical protein